jgi:CRP-like cAMP-binding protein
MHAWSIKDLQSVMRPAWPGQISEQAAGRLLACGRILSFSPGSLIVRQGSPPKGLHILLEGQADVTALRPSGKEMVINILGPGQGYSFLHVYHPDPHTSSLVARSQCQVLTVATRNWLAIAQECPELKDAVIAIISARLRGAIEELTFSALHTGLARLAHRLLVHVLQSQQIDFSGLAERGFEVALTQLQLASLVGLSRQRTHALLHQLEQRKALRLSYGRITVHDLGALRQVIADSEGQ